jgi:uncharacterized membrane protein
MTVGPVDVYIVGFRTDRPGPEVVAAVRDVVNQGLVRILDLVFVAKQADGELRVVELAEDEEGLGLREVLTDVRELISDEDIALIADDLDPGSSALFIVVENVWARRVAAAVRDADGQVLLHVRVPAQDVEAALAAAPT